MAAGLPKWCRPVSVVHFLECATDVSRQYFSIVFPRFVWRRPAVVLNAVVLTTVVLTTVVLTTVRQAPLRTPHFWKYSR